MAAGGRDAGDPGGRAARVKSWRAGAGSHDRHVRRAGGREDAGGRLRSPAAASPREDSIVRRSVLHLLPAALAAFACAVAPAQAAHKQPELLKRAVLPADASAPAPFPRRAGHGPGARSGRHPARGGFSALLDAGKKDTFWAMPDNGFGSKANSRSFLLRVYQVKADFETRRGGSGDVEILDWITLRDPDRRIPWAIVNGDTPQRLLTGGDLDLESMRVDRDGDLWFGEEFGPFLVHTDATGKVLEAPIPLPGVTSPDFPADAPGAPAGPANLGRSNGFEGMAISHDGRTLYPILEGAVEGDDPRVRRLYTFDIDARRYEDGYLPYEVADPTHLVSDFTRLDDRRFIALERDNLEGAAARHKKAFVIDPRVRTATETPIKREVVDLLNVRDPAGISLPGRPGDVGLGDPFSMPYVTLESVLPLGGGRLAFVNDTNFGSRGRNPELPDPSDLVVVRVRGLEGQRQNATSCGVPRLGRRDLAVIATCPTSRPIARDPTLIAAIDPILRSRGGPLGDIRRSDTSRRAFAGPARAVRLLRRPVRPDPGDTHWRTATGRTTRYCTRSA
jgi:hypothetical protein